MHELSWWVTAVILVREVGVTLLRFAVIKRGVIAASRGGKLKTLLQMVAISLYVLPGPFGAARPVLMGIAVVVTVVDGRRLRAARGPAAAPPARPADARQVTVSSRPAAKAAMGEQGRK